jgi:hypothetical protein
MPSSFNVPVGVTTDLRMKKLIAVLGPRADCFYLRLVDYVALHHPEDGTLTGYTAEDIESALAWDGKKGVLSSALIKIGFLKHERKHFRISAWGDDNGHLSALTRRAKAGAAERWRRYREGQNNDAQAGASIAQAEGGNAPTLPPSQSLPTVLNGPNSSIPKPTAGALGSRAGSGSADAHGSGNGKAGNMGGALSGALSRTYGGAMNPIDRIEQVKLLLAPLDINTEVKRKLTNLAHVTPEMITKNLEQLKRQHKIGRCDSVEGTLVNRLERGVWPNEG